jgi:hypothetical protein
MSGRLYSGAMAENRAPMEASGPARGQFGLLKQALEQRVARQRENRQA